MAVIAEARVASEVILMPERVLYLFYISGHFWGHAVDPGWLTRLRTG